MKERRIAPTRLAAQTYTVRTFTETAADFAQSLEKIARIGYRGVQLSAVRALDSGAVVPAEARRLLDANGLACAATHRPWSRLQNHLTEEIALHQTLGCPFTAIGGLPDTYRAEGAEGFRRFLQDAAPIVERLNAEGIRFGYHNHEWEFARIERGVYHRPETLYDIFVRETVIDLCLEIDVYWAWQAGVDPGTLLRRCTGRLPLIHLKDSEVAPEGVIMAAVGEGNLPWNSILSAAEVAGVQWYAVEQDECPRDPFDCLRSSFDFLTTVY